MMRFPVLPSVVALNERSIPSVSISVILRSLLSLLGSKPMTTPPSISVEVQQDRPAYPGRAVPSGPS